MSNPDAANLLDPAAISRAETLGLHARFVVEGYMAGEHKSPYRGFAIEFAQHREYTHGELHYITTATCGTSSEIAWGHIK